MIRKYLHIAVLGLVAFLQACNGGVVTDERKETGVKGNITIAVDQTLQPVMEQQLKVWDSSYPEGKIKAVYTSEREAFQKLFSDSARLIVVTRDITESEKQAGLRKKVVYSSLSIARDAAAIIIHPEAEDKKMTMGMLANILQGKFPRKYNIVFDDANSSLVRLVQDSVLKGQAIPDSTVFAAGDNEKVIDYVSQHKDAIGIVGLNHIYDPEDVTGTGKFISKVHVVALQGENDMTHEFYEPYQAYIALKRYPLSREIYFITGETWRGLGTGFANFLSQPPGQTIFKKAYMVPLRAELQIIEGKIN